MINKTLMNAILAMDSYNRGYNPKLTGLSSTKDTKIGNAVIQKQSDIAANSEEVKASFYAISYTYNNETIISYRGTDNTSLLPGSDIWNGWLVGGGAYKSDQAYLAADFLKSVVGNSNPYNVNVEFVGHSLGGGLAGLIARLYNKEATIFDNMPFESAANGAYQFSTAIDNRTGLLIDQELRDQYYFNSANPQPYPLSSDYSNIKAYATKGELLGYNFHLRDAQNTPVIELDSHSANQGGYDLHSQALLVTLLYARDIVINADWNKISKELTDALFNNDIAKSLGIMDNIDTTKGSADQMLTKIAYSALHATAESGTNGEITNDELIFGDTAIQALFNDANELGKVMSLNNLANVFQPTPDLNPNNSHIRNIQESIAKMLVQFAGKLAQDKVLYSDNNQAVKGMLKLSEDSKDLTINLSHNLWGTSSPIDKAQMLNDLYVKFGITDVSIMPGVSDIENIVLTTTNDGMNYNGNLLEVAGGSNLIFGAEGNDIMQGSIGKDIIFGGKGIDTYVFDSTFGNFGQDIINDDGLGDNQGSKDIIKIDNDIIQGDAIYYTDIDGDKVYRMNVGGGDEYQLRLTGNKLTIISGAVGASDLNSVVVNDFSFGDYGINLGKYSDEIQVNTHTNGSQMYQEITTLVNGNFVVAWENQDLDGFGGIYAQLFGANGSKIGDEIQVSANNNSEQHLPKITNLINGNFVITWKDNSQDNFGHIYAQLFNSDGNKIGTEIKVDNGNNLYQNAPEITAFDNGNFIIAWAGSSQNGFGATYFQLFDSVGNKIGSENQTNVGYNSYSLPKITTLTNNNFVITWQLYGLENSEVYAQLFSSDGSKIGNEIVVNTYINDYQEYPAITSLTNGNFVITWHSFLQDGFSNGIYAQLFSSDGTKISNEIKVSTTNNYDQAFPKVTNIANGNFVVIWTQISYGQDENADGIYAQVFDSSGNKIGDEIKANTNLGYKYAPEIIHLSNNNFIITWTSPGQDGSSHGVYIQIFDASGNKIGTEIQVNTYIEGPQYNSKITSLADGGFVITWQSYGQDGSENGIYAQIFNVNGEKIAHITHEASGAKIISSFAPETLNHLSTEEIEQINNNNYLERQGSNFSENITTAQNTDNNFVDAKGGNDHIKTFAGNDIINAGSGDDVVDGGFGNDILSGGLGADTFIISKNTNLVAIKTTITDFEFNNLNEKIDLSAFTEIRNFSDLIITEGSAIINLPNGQTIRILNARPEDMKAENFIFYNAQSSHQIQNIITGTNSKDTLTGTNLNDQILGGVNADILYGALGNDTLLGGSSDDILIGGVGSDILDGGTAIDTASYNDSNAAVAVNLQLNTNINNPNFQTAKGGTAQGDILINIENLTGSNFNDNLTGNHLSNVIDGGAGNDIINGGGGNDKLIGGAGADIIDGGDGIDTVHYTSSNGAVNINLELNTNIINSNQTNLTQPNLTQPNPNFQAAGGGTANGDILINIENITGSDFGDNLTGDNNKNLIYGGAGNDNIFGQDGNDTLYGGAHNDIINGDNGNDRLIGDTGNDILIGGAGADVLTGGAGRDKFVFDFFSDSSATIDTNNIDIITDFKSGEDQINLHNLNLINHITFDDNPNDNQTVQGLSYYFDNDNNTIIRYQDNNQEQDLVIKLVGHINLGNGDFGF